MGYPAGERDFLRSSMVPLRQQLRTRHVIFRGASLKATANWEWILEDLFRSDLAETEPRPLRCKVTADNDADALEHSQLLWQDYGISTLRLRTCEDADAFMQGLCTACEKHPQAHL